MKRERWQSQCFAPELIDVNAIAFEQPFWQPLLPSDSLREGLFLNVMAYPPTLLLSSNGREAITPGVIFRESFQSSFVSIPRTGFIYLKDCDCINRGNRGSPLKLLSFLLNVYFILWKSLSDGSNH